MCSGNICAGNGLRSSAKGIGRVQGQDLAGGQDKTQGNPGALKVGERAPDFTLPSTDDKKVSLKHFAGKKHAEISFVPACYTPVCSEQWPHYDQAKQLFYQNNTTLHGITVDNIPALHAWVKDMEGVWFHVLADFWPHGAVAKKYGGC